MGVIQLYNEGVIPSYNEGVIIDHYRGDYYEDFKKNIRDKNCSRGIHLKVCVYKEYADLVAPTCGKYIFFHSCFEGLSI